MPHEVYVFGDSHWRVGFPFVNHGDAKDNVSHTQDGITTIDTIANELSGATMWGLQNDSSKIGARRRILNTIDALGGVDNVLLTFGEVDARYHHDRYFPHGKFSEGRVMELVARYYQFVDEELLASGRVRNHAFIYHGYDYPQGERTLLQPGQPIGWEGWGRAMHVTSYMHGLIRDCQYGRRVSITPMIQHPSWVSDDGVHLIPEKVYPFVLSHMKLYLT